ncbi:MAG: CDP-alcohol phosphatidyltransferase family protein [Hyphomonadaceae bacterium]
MSLSWIPNAVTLLRIAAAPLVGWLVWSFLTNTELEFKEVYAGLAFGIFSIAALTDWLDGFLARALNATSDLGAKLDLWADKALVFAVLVALLSTHPVIAIYGLICLSVRDIFVMRLRSKRPDVNLKATFLAKSKTAIIMGAMALCMLAFSLTMNASRLGDAAQLELMNIILRIGLSVFVFGCVLSLGTGVQYFLAAAGSKESDHSV